MNPIQIEQFNESIRYCDKLLGLLEEEKDTIRRCFDGEPLRAYLESTEEAIKQARTVRNSLLALQAAQQEVSF